ncbi:MAG TPA: PspC domain-containing protein [Terracidiphilus sp.]|jgi:phage shock protein C
MGVYCTRCGTGMPAGARFCSSCGAAVAAPFASARPLVRPLVGRQIAGVCIGLSQAYGWDLSLVRVLAVLGLFFSCGIVVVGYIACWVGIPEEPMGIPETMPGHYPPPPPTA